MNSIRPDLKGVMTNGGSLSSKGGHIYTDPALKQNHRLHARVLRILDSRGLIHWDTECAAEVGIFFVYKKDGRLRLILDGRSAGDCFLDPPKVDLATGRAFGQLEVDGGDPVWIGTTDVCDAFYDVMIPAALWMLLACRQ